MIHKQSWYCLEKLRAAPIYFPLAYNCVGIVFLLYQHCLLPLRLLSLIGEVRGSIAQPSSSLSVVNFAALSLISISFSRGSILNITFFCFMFLSLTHSYIYDNYEFISISPLCLILFLVCSFIYSSLLFFRFP